MDETLEDAKEHAWREVAAVDAAHARGEIDDEGWHRRMAAIILPAYLGAEDPRRGSGHTGSADDWEWSRGIVAEAVDRSGTFLDVGCANGLLMESMVRWSAARGHVIEPFGLDISPELAAVARERLPRWATNIVAGNALGYLPARRFDLVRTGLEYVPAPRRRELVAWLVDEVVAPGGRLILGKANEELGDHAIEEALLRWGFPVTGRAERAHRKDPRLAYRVVWTDAPRWSDPDISFRSLGRADLPLLERWLREPHVDEWWNERMNLAELEEKYFPGIDGREPNYVHIILLGREPIGWIQWYRWSSYLDHAVRIGAEPRAAGVDLAIGDPGVIGRGLGARILRSYVDDIVFAHADIIACTSDPNEQNRRSLRAFEKAGFVALHVVEVPGEAGRQRVVRLARKGG